MKSTAQKVIGAAIVGLGLFGCGSSSNNDQGTGFHFGGLFKDGQCSTGDAGQIASLTTTGESTSSTHGILSWFLATNNMTEVGVQIERIELSYFIPGATSQPPDTSQAVGAFLDANPNSGSSQGGSLPKPPNAPVTKQCVQFFVVPPSVMTWLNLNRSALPELPFQMEVFVTLRGRTTAGAQLETNTVSLLIEFTPDVTLPGTGGSSGSASATATATPSA